MPTRSLLFCSLVLILSGITHALIGALYLHVNFFPDFESLWSGPLSIRKPILFGISAGVTTWSLDWISRQDNRLLLTNKTQLTVGLALVLEVAFITLQYWRGIPSHFTTGNLLDRVTEVVMFLLISYVSYVIIKLTYRSFSLPDLDKAKALSIQTGLIYLSISCLMGFLITFIGKVQVAQGLPPETFGNHGVLKYPHGMTLHAIQVLPVLCWMVCTASAEFRFRIVFAAALGYAFLFVHALWQTFHGLARFETNVLGLIFFYVGITLLGISFLLALRSYGKYLRKTFQRH